MPYRSDVPSLSFAGAINSAYDFGESTLPPCNACSQVIKSPAVEHMPPPAYVPVCTMSGTRLVAPLRMLYPLARFGTCFALSQYIERDIPRGAKIRFSTYSS